MPILRAHTVVTMAGPPIDNGAVAIERDRIAAVGSADDLKRRGGKLHDLGEVVLLPGLINAHCHLDFTSLRGTIPPQRSFADWIVRINQLRRDLSDEDYLRSIEGGFADAHRWGMTTIANIESVPHLVQRMSPPALRTWWFPELIDVRPQCSANQILEKSLSPFRAKKDWLGGFGLSPHALYTTSSQLLRAATEVAREQNRLVTMHVAESMEEMQMFRDGRGELFDLLRGLGRPMEDCGRGKTPLETLLDLNVLNERWIVVHLNELTGEDFERIDRAPRFHIAHCPRSSRYFDHSPFPLRRLRKAGFNIALGTDSLASNSSLNLFEEMQVLRDANTWLTPEEIFQMVTTNGAQALGQGRMLGRIEPGFYADLIALPIANQSGDLFERIVAWNGPVSWTMISGRQTQIPS